jgi:protein-disulfide isomerase
MTSGEENAAPAAPAEIRKIRPILVWAVGLAAAFALGLGAGYLVWVRPLQAQLTAVQASATQSAETAQQAAQEQAANNQDPQQQEVKRYDIPLDGDPVQGAADAPITIIEFSDYQCPYCRKWHVEVLPQLKAKYGDQIRMVYRDFPLYSIHPEAEPAAIAANCAGEQDSYYEYGDLLFVNQSSLGAATYEKLAQDIKLDVPKFQACVAENRYKEEVDADYAFASELGVRSTPTFFINGLAIVGAQPFDVFEQVIDMELSGQIP